MASVFPHLSRTQIREFLDLAAGDHIWASELILDGVQIGSDLSTEPEDDVRQTTSIDETTQVPKVGTTRYIEATVPGEAEAPQMQSDISVNHSLPHVPFAVDSPTIAPASSRSFSITRQFIQDAQELYGFALGIPPVDLCKFLVLLVKQILMLLSFFLSKIGFTLNVPILYTPLIRLLFYLTEFLF